MGGGRRPCAACCGTTLVTWCSHLAQILAVRQAGPDVTISYLPNIASKEEADLHFTITMDSPQARVTARCASFAAFLHRASPFATARKLEHNQCTACVCRVDPDSLLPSAGSGAHRTAHQRAHVAVSEGFFRRHPLKTLHGAPAPASTVGMPPAAGAGLHTPQSLCTRRHILGWCAILRVL